ncbi:hypothetical protein JW826_02240 [Candidatus Woesearchaeota archaeon]|nr:hypothetical protein [Candidatus Woesearchaeota archaeon]
MNAFARSWAITKLSLDVIRKDKELVMFPILSGIFSLLLMAALIIPALVFSAAAGIAGGDPAAHLMTYAVIFIIYLGLSIIATFFNVATVHTVKKRFEGGNATFGESVNYAFSRMDLILAWSLLSATVGLILNALDHVAEKLGTIGEIAMRIITSILGAAWSIMTIFVVPAMVYKGLGPIDAIKSSVTTLRKTWGESLIREFGTGFLAGMLAILGAILWFVVIMFSTALGGTAVLTALCLAFTYFVALFVFFGLVNAVFNTALYVYADTGKVPAFNEGVLNGAFRKRH